MACKTALWLTDQLDPGLLEKLRGYLVQCREPRSKQQLKSFAACRNFLESTRMSSAVEPAVVKPVRRKMEHSSHIRTRILLSPSSAAGTKMWGRFGLLFV